MDTPVQEKLSPGDVYPQDTAPALAGQQRLFRFSRKMLAVALIAAAIVITGIFFIFVITRQDSRSTHLVGSREQPGVPTQIAPSVVPTFIPTTQPVFTDTNMYVSANLGIAFKKPVAPANQTLFVRESGDKICLTLNQADVSCTTGQWVEVFTKPNELSLEAVIRERFLAGKSPNDCLVTRYFLRDEPENYKAAEITFPLDGLVTAENISQKTNQCSAQYARSNGIRYFFQDLNKQGKFLFFNIGQSTYMTSENIPWQDTILVYQ